MENNIIKKSKSWYMKKRWWAVAVVVAGLVGWYFFLGGDKAPTYEKITVKRGDLIQEVSVTGKIKPAQAVDLQFESSGRISVINYKVGSKVNSGAVIASLENQDLQAEVTSAKASLDKTVKDFNSLNDPSVASSLRVELENAKINLEQAKKKAEGDLASDYSSAFNTVREAMTQLDNSLAVLEYLRKTYFETNYSINPEIQKYQAETNTVISDVKVIFPEINTAGTVITPEMYSEMDTVLRKMLSGCQTLRSGFTYLQGQIQSNPSYISSATDRANVNSEATALSSDLSAVSNAIQNIADQRITNSKSITDAEAKLATAESAFPTSEDVLQKEATLLAAQSKLRKSLIVAPFTGIVGKIDAERGQTVSATTPIVSLISAAKYQVEANITEVDIGKIMLNNSAKLTLDAYGPQVKFNTVVTAIDTAASIVEGVTTYKTVFDFVGDIDPGIRPNMTANIDVETARKANVISIPQRAVITKNGDKIVRIYKGENVPFEERIVKLGISGGSGFIEIVSGLNEGEEVITFINE